MSLPSRHAGYRLSDLTETWRWGRALGTCLHAGDVIALIGDLGAGKTTLTQAIAQGMQISEPVTSPTFALAQEYPGRLPLFHFDPYRLDSAEAFADIGFEEYFERGGVIVVEWADKIASLLPESRLTLTLALDDEANTEGADGLEEAPRLLDVEAIGERYMKIMQEVDAVAGIASLRRSSQ